MNKESASDNAEFDIHATDPARLSTSDGEGKVQLEMNRRLMRMAYAQAVNRFEVGNLMALVLNLGSSFGYEIYRKTDMAKIAAATGIGSQSAAVSQAKQAINGAR